MRTVKEIAAEVLRGHLDEHGVITSEDINGIAQEIHEKEYDEFIKGLALLLDPK